MAWNRCGGRHDGGDGFGHRGGGGSLVIHELVAPAALGWREEAREQRRGAVKRARRSARRRIGRGRTTMGRDCSPELQ